jgi:antitoxin MazE
MVTKIQKWGNSLALRIPKSFAAEAKVVAGSTVDISVANGGLVVRPTRRPKYVLGELLKGIKPGNLHEEVSTGERVGVEAW